MGIMALERIITGHRTGSVLYVEARCLLPWILKVFFRRLFVSFHVVALGSGVRRGNGNNPEEGGRSLGGRTIERRWFGNRHAK